jgi:hypothetical protein
MLYNKAVKRYSPYQFSTIPEKYTQLDLLNANSLKQIRFKIILFRPHLLLQQTALI